MVRDNIDIQIRQLNQAICQAFFPCDRILLVVNAPHDNLCHTTDPGIFCNLHSRICTIYGRNLGPQLLCQTQVIAQPLDILA